MNIPLVDLAHNLESLLSSILIQSAGLQGSHVLLSRVAQDVECVLARQTHQLAGF